MIYRLLKYYFGFILIILHIEINGKSIFTIFAVTFCTFEIRRIHRCSEYGILRIILACELQNYTASKTLRYVGALCRLYFYN